MMFELLIAFCIITSPDLDEEIITNYSNNPIIVSNIYQLSINLELLDQNQVNCSSSSNYKKEIVFIRDRYKDLKDCPSIEMTKSIPEVAIIYEMLRDNREYLEVMELRQSLDIPNKEFYRQAIEETKLLYEFWDCMSSAKYHYNDIKTRREFLNQAKLLIGRDKFYAFNFPPALPIWRFQEIK